MLLPVLALAQNNPNSPSPYGWTWMGGSSTANQAGIYGTLGQPAAANVPGARSQAVTVTDKYGNLWLFGGDGYDSAGISGNLGDLWKLDTTSGQWTWVSGSDVTDHTLGALPANYGLQGTASISNNPGTRDAAIGWSDSNGKFWLFGGYGIDPTGTWGFYNDLWKFDPSTDQWTWMSGDDTMSSFGGHAGVYGGVGAHPGSRIWAGSWTDNNGHIWLFGGYGFDGLGNGSGGLLNDLWRN